MSRLINRSTLIKSSLRSIPPTPLNKGDFGTLLKVPLIKGDLGGSDRQGYYAAACRSFAALITSSAMLLGQGE
jgi:hypothetical protein